MVPAAPADGGLGGVDDEIGEVRGDEGGVGNSLPVLGFVGWWAVCVGLSSRPKKALAIPQARSMMAAAMPRPKSTATCGVAPNGRPEPLGGWTTGGSGGSEPSSLMSSIRELSRAGK